MSKSHFDHVTSDKIPLIKRLKQYEMLRWIKSAEGALAAPPFEVLMEFTSSLDLLILVKVEKTKRHPGTKVTKLGTWLMA